MFEQLNELKYKAQNGKTYLMYFLKYWEAADKSGDLIVKYQIRSSDKDFVWYGRISRERAVSDLKSMPRKKGKLSKKELNDRIKAHLKRLFVYVAKKGLDKGYEQADTEFVFYKKPHIEKRIWRE